MISTDGVVSLNGATIRGKPVDDVTIAVWLNLYGDGKVHPVFSVVNAKGQSKCLLQHHIILYNSVLFYFYSYIT